MRPRLFLVLVGMAMAAGPGWGEDLAVTVSPGSATGSVIGDACPAFSWGAVEGALRYELVVYRLGAEEQGARPVLREVLVGSASSWTPSLDRCLERGGRYAWSVRALDRKQGASWSAPSFFRVASGPSGVELERALEVVKKYLDSGSDAPTSPGSLARTGTSTESISAAKVPSPAREGIAATDALVVDGGVVAAYYWGDGAGLSNLDWASLTNVPSGFADGIDNDADTLSALRCSNGQVAKSDGSGGWTCAANVPAETSSSGTESADASMQPSLAINFMIALQGEYPGNNPGGFYCASSPCVGEIRLIANDYAPPGWALCQGQLLQVSQWTALFTLLGTTYGGDGVSTFALPDLRGRAPIGAGAGPNLTNRSHGEALGGENRLKAHVHAIAPP